MIPIGGKAVHNTIDEKESIEAVKNNNFNLIDESPRDGAEGKKIAFVHPSSTSGVLIELEQE